ncbi:hypothetical protein SAMN04488063_2954 [Halopelagius inordinatus]|uniref:Uncharacterized protein n=1 Tax=Halopelagius inordinatus TaxID=553467 RepID=A0A1I2UPV3_9EURY|nr:hypothetical protein [Halopelagius inordinatus]SFG79113.1 hypothetical protein SAMN04488063_2954 [Halopelagius inordinatus]
MNRRALLLSLGSVAFAGCTAGDGPSGTGAESTTAASSPETTTADPNAPAVPDVGVPPNEASGPPWDDDVTRVVSWTEATEETPIRLTPARSRGPLPTAGFEFALRNDTDARFAFNDYGWSVWKRVDGEWFHVEPRYWPEPLRYLGPGESHAWTLTVDNDRLDGTPLSPVEGRRSVTLVGLGGGTYAFTVDGWFESEDYENGVGFAARFELDGDPVELTPTDEVTETTRDGDTVVVATDADSGSDAQTVAFVVRRADGESGDGGDDVRRILTEQALRDRTLRNTLPFFEAGVETVRLEGRASSAPAFGVSDGGRIEYEGDRYLITTEKIETAGPEADG